MKRTAITAAALHLPSPTVSEATVEPAKPVALGWLGEKTPTPGIFPGTTWGVPWPRGLYRPNTPFSLQTETGDAQLPLQTWPLSYWPDGTLKWTAHALASDNKLPLDKLQLIPGKEPSKLTVSLSLHETATEIIVDTGVLQCRIPRKGPALISQMTRGGKTLGQDVRLICLRRDQPEDNEESNGTRQERFTGLTTSATIEQNGPVRAVVRLEGKHKAKTDKGREWLPFTIRLYFYAGSDSVRLMHTFLFDGDENKDFISGLGLRFSVPLSDSLQDRHIRFASENGGLWGEAARTLTGLRRDPGASVKADQVAEKQRLPPNNYRVLSVRVWN